MFLGAKHLLLIYFVILISLCRVNYRTEVPEETDEEPTLDPVMHDSSSVCSVSSQVNAKHTNTVDSQILPSPRMLS